MPRCLSGVPSTRGTVAPSREPRSAPRRRDSTGACRSRPWAFRSVSGHAGVRLRAVLGSDVSQSPSCPHRVQGMPSCAGQRKGLGRAPCPGGLTRPSQSLDCLCVTETLPDRLHFATLSSCICIERVMFPGHFGA